MRHGRLPFVWGGNGRGDRKGGERVIGGEWVYRIGITLSENYPDGVENSLSAYNLVLVSLHPSNKCVKINGAFLHLSFQPTFCLSG